MRIGFIAFIALVTAVFAGEVEVRMTVPTNTVYFDEDYYPFSVTISNGTQRAYRMFAGGYWAFRAQLYFELENENETQRFTAMGVLPRKNDASLYYINNSTRGDIVMLSPGEKLVWDFGEEPLFDMSPLGTNQMRAVVLMGTNEWARSPLCPVKFSTRSIESGTRVYSNDYIPRGRGINLRVNRLEENGQQILFDHHSRIVSFPIGDTVTFALDETTGALTVTSSSGASVRWDTVNQRRLPPLP
ncbi:MAG: hypothetical protein IJU44_01895 [Kiritimatiellae bacterium]|nr:hypothetical protein [Kiritimatiellia bacterium]